MSVHLRGRKPFTATAAVRARLRELGKTAADLADKAEVPYTTVKYFGLLAHDRETRERLSIALGWSPNRLSELCDGERLD